MVRLRRGANGVPAGAPFVNVQNRAAGSAPSLSQYLTISFVKPAESGYIALPNKGESMNFTRRELLERCAAFGAITVATSLPLAAVAAAWDDAEMKRQPTPFCELGPFYKREAPHTSQLRAPGDSGMPLALAGVVYDVRGDVVPDAKLEVWQTDNDGHYDIGGYRYRAVLEPGAKGAYSIESVMPGHYPTRV